MSLLCFLAQMLADSAAGWIAAAVTYQAALQVSWGAMSKGTAIRCTKRCLLRNFLCIKNEPPAGRRPSRSCKQLQRQRSRAAFIAPAGHGGGIRIWKVAVKHSRPNRSHHQPPSVFRCTACSARLCYECRISQIRAVVCFEFGREVLCVQRHRTQ